MYKWAILLQELLWSLLAIANFRFELLTAVYITSFWDSTSCMLNLQLQGKTKNNELLRNSNNELPDYTVSILQDKLQYKSRLLDWIPNTGLLIGLNYEYRITYWTEFRIQYYYPAIKVARLLPANHHDVKKTDTITAITTWADTYVEE
jgi:hypothetical protein